MPTAYNIDFLKKWANTRFISRKILIVLAPESYNHNWITELSRILSLITISLYFLRFRKHLQTGVSRFMEIFLFVFIASNIVTNIWKDMIGLEVLMFLLKIQNIYFYTNIWDFKRLKTAITERMSTQKDHSKVKYGSSSL